MTKSQAEKLKEAIWDYGQARYDFSISGDYAHVSKTREDVLALLKSMIKEPKK